MDETVIVIQPDEWRRRAVQYRMRATHTRDGETRLAFNRLAEDCESIAAAMDELELVKRSNGVV